MLKPARHLMRFDYYTEYGYLVCWLDYEAGDPGVGANPTAWLMHVQAGEGGMEITDILSSKLINEIEEAAACSFSEE